MLPFLAIPLSLVLTYYIVTYYALPVHRRRKLRALIPLYGFEDRQDTYDNYVKSTRQLHYAGYKKFIQRSLPYRVKTSAGGERIILPFKFLVEVKNAPQSAISLPDEMEELLLMKYTGVPQRTDSGTKVVRVDMTRSLGNFVQSMNEECVHGFQKYLPVSKDWQVVKPYHVLAKIVALISGRVLVGKELCRNEDWIRLSMEFSTHAFGAARTLRSGNKWPWSMRWASYTEPAVKAIIERRREAEALMKPICEERLRRAADPSWKKPEDATQWLLDSHSRSGESADEVVKSQLRLTMAAIHNTTMSITNDLFDLIEHPEYIDVLRQEVDTVVTEERGWTKQALTKMRKMDSFMKESQRMNPSTPITCKRKVLQDFRLHDGSVLPRGSHIAFTSDAVNRDPEIYPSPNDFDGLRFYRLRTASVDGADASDLSTSANETKYQFVTATQDYQNWGAGRSACPGRFFASNEIKLMLSYLLQNYEFKWKGGEGRPESAVIDWNILPDREKEVLFRRRKQSGQ
ncbi:Putative cytochrome P450 [Septoria linicola]|uniref:Cytochrome P450 n=1 Tax=Septoria linicola TaxID=215465 RepID=A0A9Q9EGU6_9PEZI|nr:putative cytochrome P450 [Septoria linicola]USW51151.1 Putative cytochrome P450 [Septoria linicola]